MATNISSISKAFADNANSIHIPKPAGVAPYKDSGAAFVGKGHLASGLPTPPNSISPNLPAHSLAARARREHASSPPDQVDSDVELGDAVDPAKASPGSTTGENGHGNITPAMIARDYLPAIILGKGQVPVKDVINHLCKHLPGFADIPPAKARRIVGAALEGHVGGPEGNVEFEKTGWGRWNAKIRTQPLRTITEHRAATGYNSTAAVKIPGHSSAARPKPRRISSGSWAAENSLSSPSEHGDNMDTDVFQQDVDAMSIDDDGDQRMRYTLAQNHHRSINTYSDTDEEDWASMGAAAFRPSSFSSRAGVHKHNKIRHSSRTRSPMPGGLARSVPTHTYHSHHQQRPQQPLNLDFTGIEANTQEREAIEALMRMGSM